MAVGRLAGPVLSYADRVPLLALALVLLAPLLAIVLAPVTLVQRYRAGTARRRARRWLAMLNVSLTAVSAVFLIVFAVITNVWVSHAAVAALSGLTVGALLGTFGLGLTRWESTPYELHYTPHRWLVLTVTLVVSLRLVYGLWRGWIAWWQHGGDVSWLAAAGVPGSLAAGALVLGYYIAFWAGVMRRARRVARRPVPRPGIRR